MSLKYLGLFLLLGNVCWASVPGNQVDERQCVDAVSWSGRLVVLESDGTFLAWSLSDLQPDSVAVKELALPDALHVTCGQSRLWVATKTAVYSHEVDVHGWTKVAELTENEQPLLALVLVGDAPLLVYPSKVVDPITKRSFKVPEVEGMIKINLFGMHDHWGTTSMAWIGTGYGEWGGHLIGFDLKKETWVHFYDGLHYVTGITQSDSDYITVAWSMSHFMANTLIREHDITGKPFHQEAELESKYYQRIAFSSFDQALYGIENKSLVRIIKGQPTEIVKLTGRLFEREPKAIGVAPGIRALIPVARSVVMVVPIHGQPLSVSVDTKKVTTLPQR